jgi:hypothetical protein
MAFIDILRLNSKLESEMMILNEKFKQIQSQKKWATHAVTTASERRYAGYDSQHERVPVCAVIAMSVSMADQLSYNFRFTWVITRRREPNPS